MLAGDEIPVESPDAPEETNPAAALGMRQAGAWGAIQAERPALDTFYVLPECAPVLAMWNAMHTQWRWISGLESRRVGLDYVGIRASPAFRAIRGRRQREEMLADLCVMETAWLVERARLAEERRAERDLPPLPPLS